MLIMGKFRCFYLLTLSKLLGVSGDKDSGNKIVGGTTVSIKQYPYQLSVEFANEHYCGASVITKYNALTAAHCFKHLDQLDLYKVRAGSSLQGTGGTLKSIKKLIIHPQYKQVTKDNDVAVLLLDSKFEFSDIIKPIALADKMPKNTVKATATGWGYLEEGGSTSYNLQAVQVSLISDLICKSRYPTKYTQRMFCAGNFGTGGKDSCQGDSGGPLVYKDKQIGIVSFGRGCGQRLYPGVYVKIPEVLPFIQKHIQI